MATNPSKPHDGLFKSSMTNIRVATDFFEGHLPSAILQKTDLTTLQLTNHSFIDEGLGSKESDLVYTVQINQRDAFIYLLCEHQSTIDQYMALRILTYVLRIFTMHIKQNPSEKYLPIVYPMVVYNGKPVWNAPTDIFDLFEEEDRALAKTVLFKPYQLLDICRMSDDEIKQRFWSGLFEFTLKHQRSKNFHAFVEQLFPWVNEVSPQEGGSQYANIVLKYTISRVISDDDRDYFLNAMNQWLAPELRSEMMTIAQEFRQLGRSEGLAEGRAATLAEAQAAAKAKMATMAQELEQRGVKLVASRLLAKDMSAEDVANLTELSLEIVEKIQLKNQNDN